MKKASSFPKESQIGECLKFEAAAAKINPNRSTPRMCKAVSLVPNSHTKNPETKPNTTSPLMK